MEKKENLFKTEEGREEKREGKRTLYVLMLYLVFLQNPRQKFPWRLFWSF